MTVFIINRETNNKVEVLDRDMIFEEGMEIKLQGKPYVVDQIEYLGQIAGPSCRWQRHSNSS